MHTAEFKTKKMPASDVQHGFTVLIDGETKSVCKNNITTGFHGTLIHGHLFREGIDVVLFKTWRKGECIGYTTNP